MNGKFKPDDTKIFFIGVGSMCKAIKDNILKPNGRPDPIIIAFGIYILSFISLTLLFTSSLNLSYSDSLSMFCGII